MAEKPEGRKGVWKEERLTHIYWESARKKKVKTKLSIYGKWKDVVAPRAKGIWRQTARYRKNINSEQRPS
jgi:hypothetical protein